MKKIKTKAFTALVSLALLFSSCSFNSTEGYSEKARIILSVNASEKASRTILPSSLTESDIDHISFTALNAGTADIVQTRNWNKAPDIGKTAFDILGEDTNLYLDPGTYDFVIEIYTFTELYQRGQLENKTIKSGTNTLAFKTYAVTGSTDKGSFYISLNWTSDSVNSIKAGLFTSESDGETAVSGHGLSDIALNGKTAFFAESDIPAGTYFVRFELYDSSQNLLNTIEDLIKIVSGRTTQTEIALSELNENSAYVQIEITFPEYSEMDVTCTIEGSRITITAPEGYDSYYWEFDTMDKGFFERSVSVDFSEGDQSQIPKGYYDVYIEATKTDGTVHSFCATVKIQ